MDAIKIVLGLTMGGAVVIVGLGMFAIALSIMLLPILGVIYAIVVLIFG